MEVKTSVALTMATIDGQQLAQVFIQAFYTLESYCLETIVVALTDKVTWHFFEICKFGHPHSIIPLISVKWMHSVFEPEKVVSLVASCLVHLNFEK